MRFQSRFVISIRMMHGIDTVSKICGKSTHPGFLTRSTSDRICLIYFKIYGLLPSKNLWSPSLQKSMVSLPPKIYSLPSSQNLCQNQLVVTECCSLVDEHIPVSLSASAANDSDYQNIVLSLLLLFYSSSVLVCVCCFDK